MATMSDEQEQPKPDDLEPGEIEMRLEILCRFKPGDPESVKYGFRKSEGMSAFNIIQFCNKAIGLALRDIEKEEAQVAQMMVQQQMGMNRAERRSKGGVILPPNAAKMRKH